jgi:hypothetical protein
MHNLCLIPGVKGRPSLYRRGPGLTPVQCRDYLKNLGILLANSTEQNLCRKV